MTKPTRWPHGRRPAPAPIQHTLRVDSRPTARQRAAIPLTVWPCGPRALHCHRAVTRERCGAAPIGVLGPELVARIVLAYTRPGDLVALASGASLAASTIEGLQRRCASLVSVLANAAMADLVLVTPRWAPSLSLARVADQCCLAGRVLRSGGFLVAVSQPGCSADRGTVGRRPSDVVRAAQRAGFGYLQHNVAVHAPIAGDGLTSLPRRPATRPAGRALPAHRVVHLDVLVFTARESADG